MSDTDSDTVMRLAAFAHIRQLLELRDALTASDLKPGFQFGGVRIPLINPRRIWFATGRRNGSSGRREIP
jgi:putative restriction endonuclease